MMNQIDGIPKVFTDHLTTEQYHGFVDLAQKLYVDVNWMLAISWRESNFKTTIQNKSTNAVGLFQFTRDKKHPGHPELDYKVIDGKKYMINTIKAMTFQQQLDLGYLYFKQFKGKLKTFIDSYMACFFPLAIGKDDNYVLQTNKLSASLIASQNSGYDINKDKKITKAEVIKNFQKYYGDLDFSLIDKSQTSDTLNQSSDDLIKQARKKKIINLLLFFIFPVLLLLLVFKHTKNPNMKNFYQKHKKAINIVLVVVGLPFLIFRIYKIFKN